MTKRIVIFGSIMLRGIKFVPKRVTLSSEYMPDINGLKLSCDGPDKMSSPNGVPALEKAYIIGLWLYLF